MASRTSGQPLDEDTRDGQSSGDEGIGEVTFKPRIRANSEDAPVRARGGNAATVR
jgi:hypothetical protein